MGEFPEARTMFFDHLGSAFYMDRNGVRERFDRYRVPAAVQREWLRELFTQQLAALHAPGNWAVVSFLNHHGDLAHLPELVAAAPRGRLWERCAYLEDLLGYLDRCAKPEPHHRGRPELRYGSVELRAALEKVITHAAALRRTARSAKGLARVNAIITDAQARLVVLNQQGEPTRLWAWDPLTRTAVPGI